MTSTYTQMLKLLRDLSNRLRFSDYEKQVLADAIERIEMLESCAECAETFPKS